MGRRSRRFFLGAEIPDGVFAHKSRHAPLPLSETEKMLLVAACGGNTAWHHMIYRGEPYAPHLSNYAGAAGGRTFPSAAGFHTSTTFFTDDDGRLRLPSEMPYAEAHNTWVLNKRSTFLVIPVGDLSQHVLLNILLMLQNGLVLFHDIHGRPISGIEVFRDVVDVDNT